jgi:hypothetical protein
MHHYLVILLSTDWFFPFWFDIGLEIDRETKAQIQQRCRDFVKNEMAKKSVDDEGEFRYINCDEECKSKAKYLLMEFLQRFDDLTHHGFAVIERWSNRDEDGVRSALMLRMLSHDLIEGVSAEGNPAPGLPIRAAVKQSCKNYDLDPTQFEEISMKSQSIWDKYVQSLFHDDVPTTLSDQVTLAVYQERLCMLWNRISERVTLEQGRELLSWYRAAAKSRVSFDPVPSFIGGV